MYLLADGSPRYGIRGQTDTSVPAAASPATFGRAVERAAVLDNVQLDFIGRFPQASDDAVDFRKLREAHPADLKEAAGHVKAVLGSPRAWLRAAEQRGDKKAVEDAGLGESLRHLGLVVTVLSSALVPVAAAIVFLLQEQAFLTAAGAYFVAGIVLLPVTRAARREMARDGLYSKRLTRREMDWIWEDLVWATFIEILTDRGADVTPGQLRAAAAAWEYHTHVAKKVEEMRSGPAA